MTVDRNSIDGENKRVCIAQMSVCESQERMVNLTLSNLIFPNLT